MGATLLNQSFSLPLFWKTEEAYKNDLRWLGGIINNAAKFSDWWTRTRAVQLAYQPEPDFGADPQVYAGKTSVEEIVETLKRELQDYCQQQGLSSQQCQQQYAFFFHQVDQDFVRETLQKWKEKKFTQVIGRNFEVYADRVSLNTFLTVSTASVSLSVERKLPPAERFRPLFNVSELAEIIHQRNVRYLTLRTHGYANPANGFYKSFAKEATVLEQAEAITEQHLYIGYHWPSEQPLFNAGLYKDLIRNVGIFLKFLGSLFVLSLIPGLLVALTYDFFLPLQTRLYWMVPLVVFVLWLLAFGLLRAVVYQRDRYRAIHYGAPDLAEFFWRLDKRLKSLQDRDHTGSSKVVPPQRRQTVNLVGHSMGGLVLVNALRVLSDRFGKDDHATQVEKQLGECLDLGKLILASPDIPLELIQEGRSNYVRSAIRRCEQIYLMSSDRDIVLRYLSTLSNWFSEPSIEMTGLRLGNVYLQRFRKPNNTQEGHNIESMKDMLLIRNVLLSRQAVEATSAYDIFESFNYFDCSYMEGVNGVSLGLTPFTGLLIDIGNAVLYVLGKVDVHGGYFRTHTPTFKVLQYLLQTPTPSDDQLRLEMERCDPNGQIRFLLRQPPSVDPVISPIVESEV